MASESSLKNKFPIRCAFCQKPHYSASCEEIRDVSKRKETLKRGNRCLFVCEKDTLRNNVTKNVDDVKDFITNQYAKYMILQRKVKQNNSKDSDKKDPEGHTVAASTINQPSRSTTCKREVLLQTATTLAFSHDDSELVPVRILLDSGSQRSYATDQLKKKLAIGLNSLGTETLNLNTFEDDRVTKQRCDEVKIKLQAKPETIEISALTFAKICSPLSMKLDVDSYPHLRGLQLANSSLVNDIPTNIDILIGSDHYFDVVTDEICRGGKGPVAINTIFGWVISGPTQKDIKDDASSANLTILRGIQIQQRVDLPSKTRTKP